MLLAHRRFAGRVGFGHAIVWRRYVLLFAFPPGFFFFRLACCFGDCLVALHYCTRSVSWLASPFSVPHVPSRPATGSEANRDI
jgi:hypothetical protein